MSGTDSSIDETGVGAKPAEFRPFPKIARLFRPVVVTEKIDGTNAQILIVHGQPDYEAQVAAGQPLAIVGDLIIYAGQRTKFCTPAQDNFGFAAWVKDHAEELALLGPGQHFGEWWGAGIQRRYGLKEKRFSLFNVGRWYDVHGTNMGWAPDPKAQAAPSCCHVVPILGKHDGMDTPKLDVTLEGLRQTGSVAAPGFKPAEGIVVFHAASGALFKATCENDAEWKGGIR